MLRRSGILLADLEEPLTDRGFLASVGNPIGIHILASVAGLWEAHTALLHRRWQEQEGEERKKVAEEDAKRKAAEEERAGEARKKAAGRLLALFNHREAVSDPQK